MSQQNKIRIIVKDDENSVVECLSKLLQNAAKSSIDNNEFFKIGLSGGSMVNLLGKTLPTITTDWSKWRFFFCDERCVPFDNTDSTYGQYKSNLMRKLSLEDDQFIKINPSLFVEEAAKDYVKKMSPYFPSTSCPIFDALLLGLGPDGHTCSLFPKHKLLDEEKLWVCPIDDSPKPPPCRITFTLPLINNAKLCIFPITGSSKADIIKEILLEKKDLPAARVKPTNGALYWILDKAACNNVVYPESL